MNKELVIVAEASLNFVERFTPLADIIRKNNPTSRIIGIFVRFVDFNLPVFTDKLFDDMIFPLGCEDAFGQISRFTQSNILFLFSHIPSTCDCQLYRLSKFICEEKRYLVMRNCLNLQHFFESSTDDGKLIKPLIEQTIRKEREIHFKVFLFSLVIAAIISPIRFFRKLFVKGGGSVSRILFLKLDVLGDMIVTIPYIKALRDAYPEAEITIIASRHGAGFLEEQHKLHVKGLYNELIVWNAPWHFSSRQVFGVRELFEMLGLLPQLWRKHFDVVIQPVIFGTGVAFALLSLGKRIFAAISLGLPLSRALKPLLTDPVIIDQSRIYHMKDYVEETLRALNIERGFNNSCDLRIDNEASSFIDQFLKSHGYMGGVLIAVNVGARNPVRILSAQKFAKVISDCRKRFSATIVLLGSESEKFLADEIATLSDGWPINSAGIFTFNQLTAFISRCSLIITVDTGIMHLAAAVKVPIVAIYGAGLVESCHPLTNNYKIVKKELGCSGCADKCFSEPPAPCMEAINPDDIVESVNSILLTLNLS
ncbi:glycosyltransferase family 9 protein [Oryzomonas sagensis]|nr:glycosyltransferase family 9 protein [Oryzomonas sagensis]